MGMFARGGAVSLAVASLITLLVTKFQVILTNSALMWLLIVLACGVSALIFSWGWTQAYKRIVVQVDLYVPPDTTNMRSTDEMERARNTWAMQVNEAKRNVYGTAMLTTLLPALGSMCVLWLFPLAHTWLVVFVMLWVIGSFGLAGASPFLWKLVFETIIPWMLVQDKRHD